MKRETCLLLEEIEELQNTVAEAKDAKTFLKPETLEQIGHALTVLEDLILRGASLPIARLSGDCAVKEFGLLAVAEKPGQTWLEIINSRDPQKAAESIKHSLGFPATDEETQL